jgi:hypothetical protein
MSDVKFGLSEERRAARVKIEIAWSQDRFDSAIAASSEDLANKEAGLALNGLERARVLADTGQELGKIRVLRDRVLGAFPDAKATEDPTEVLKSEMLERFSRFEGGLYKYEQGPHFKDIDYRAGLPAPREDYRKLRKHKPLLSSGIRCGCPARLPISTSVRIPVCEPGETRPRKILNMRNPDAMLEREVTVAVIKRRPDNPKDDKPR